MLVFQDGKTTGTIGGGELEHRVIEAALEALEEGKPRKLYYSMVDPERGDPGVCGGQVEIFVEPLLPKNRLIIIGGGHVGKEVAFLGKWLGFYIVVLDDRSDIQSDLIPDADEFFSGSFQDLLTNIDLDPWTYVVLTSRNIEIDMEILPLLLNNHPAYIGVIGSKKRWETTQKGLIEKGIPIEQLNHIYSPIGLKINSETPKEIALSILSEIVMVQRNDEKEKGVSSSKVSISEKG